MRWDGMEWSGVRQERYDEPGDGQAGEMGFDGTGWSRVGPDGAGWGLMGCVQQA